MAINTKTKENGEALLGRIEVLLQEAIAGRKYDEVARLAKIADEIRMLEDQEKKIAERRGDLAMLLQASARERSAELEDLGSGEESPRERGSRVRSHYIEFVLASEGIHLVRVATKKYRTPAGLLVGIAYASELDVRPESWFLGLSDESYDFVILLCESSGGAIAAYVLPPEFVRRIWKALSRSNGQVKFHITRTSTTHELRLPGSRILKIDEYLNGVQALKGIET